MASVDHTMVALAVRDLHDIAPDDYGPNNWDVVAKFSNGSAYYSDEVFASGDAAQQFVKLVASNPEWQAFAAWRDSPLASKHIEQCAWTQLEDVK